MPRRIVSDQLPYLPVIYFYFFQVFYSLPLLSPMLLHRIALNSLNVLRKSFCICFSVPCSLRFRSSRVNTCDKRKM